MIDLTTAKPRDLVDMIPSQPIPVVQKILAEKSLKQFVKQAWHILEGSKPLYWNWHLDAICDHLEAVTNTYIVKSGLSEQGYEADLSIPNIHQLLINMPPRHMKSLLVSVFWPCWEWGPKNLPMLSYLFLSYAQELSTRDSIKRRDIFRSQWYQSNWGDRVRFSRDQNRKTRYKNTQNGEMISTSIEGIATGEGGERVVIDDGHNVKQVESQTKRESVLYLWDNTLPSRLNDIHIGSFVSVMQRTHHLDLSGHQIEKNKLNINKRLTHLCLPARYELDHPNPTDTQLDFIDPRTEEGEPLDQLRWDDERLSILESDMTEWAKSGQLQQRPVPRGGSLIMVNRIKIVDNYNHALVKKLVRYWDKAISEDASASHTASVLIAEMRDGYDYSFIILDALQGQWKAGDRDARMLQTAEMDGIETNIYIEQEPGSGGKESAQNSVSLLKRFKCTPDRPTGAKEVRLEPFAGQVENYKIAILKAAWNKEYLGSLEMCAVGNVTDYGDATSGAYNAINGLLTGQKARVRFSIR